MLHWRRRLKRADLVPTPLVATALNLSGKVCVHNALRQRLTDHALAEGQQVHVDVLDAVARGPFVLDDRSTHARDLVCRDGRPDPRSAEEDAAFHTAVRDGVGKWPDDDWIVVIGRGLGTEGDYGVATGLQVLDDRGLQTLTRVVRGDADPHTTVASTLSISASLIAPCRRILS